MEKRPAYCDGIGLFRGSKSFTVWVKVRLPHGGVYNGRTIAAGTTIEHKVGNRASWMLPQLEAERDRLQGLADRNEPLEAVQADTFKSYATDWLDRKKPVLKGYGVTKGHINTALIPTFGKKAMDAITVADVNRWIGKQRGTLAPATVQRQLSTFNAIMNDAVRVGLIDRNPATRADKIRASNHGSVSSPNRSGRRSLKPVNGSNGSRKKRANSNPSGSGDGSVTMSPGRTTPGCGGPKSLA
jgi:hypothetical protein